MSRPTPVFIYVSLAQILATRLSGGPARDVVARAVGCGTTSGKLRIPFHANRKIPLPPNLSHSLKPKGTTHSSNGSSRTQRVSQTPGVFIVDMLTECVPAALKSQRTQITTTGAAPQPDSATKCSSHRAGHRARRWETRRLHMQSTTQQQVRHTFGCS